MNPKNLLALSVLFATTAIAPLASRADDTAAPTPTPTTNADANPQPPGGPGGPRRRGGGPFNLKELTAKLNLTADQQKTVGDIINTARSQGKEVRDDDSLAKEEKQAKMKEIFTTARAQIRAALTADQQALFDAMPVRGGPGGPPPPPPAAAPPPTPPPTT